MKTIPCLLVRLPLHWLASEPHRCKELHNFRSAPAPRSQLVSVQAKARVCSIGHQVSACTGEVLEPPMGTDLVITVLPKFEG